MLFVFGRTKYMEETQAAVGIERFRLAIFVRKYSIYTSQCVKNHFSAKLFAVLSLV